MNKVAVPKFYATFISQEKLEALQSKDVVWWAESKAIQDSDGLISKQLNVLMALNPKPFKSR